MKIVDKSEEVRRELVEEKRLKNIEGLMKENFSSCELVRTDVAIGLYSPPKEKIAMFSTTMYTPGKMKLYNQFFEPQAIKFGEEYEKREFHKSSESSPLFQEGPFILEKYYLPKN